MNCIILNINNFLCCCFDGGVFGCLDRIRAGSFDQHLLPDDDAESIMCTPSSGGRGVQDDCWCILKRNVRQICARWDVSEIELWQKWK